MQPEGSPCFPNYSCQSAQRAWSPQSCIPSRSLSREQRPRRGPCTGHAVSMSHFGLFYQEVVCALVSRVVLMGGSLGSGLTLDEIPPPVNEWVSWD